MYGPVHCTYFFVYISLKGYLLLEKLSPPPMIAPIMAPIPIEDAQH